MSYFNVRVHINPIGRKTLVGFLCKARKHGYAGDGKYTDMEMGKRVFTYHSEESKASGFLYRDTYYRFNPFCGQELIWKGKEPIWAMNYFGAVTDGRLLPEYVYEFSKKALFHASPGDLRGPRYFQEKEFSYSNIWDGEIFKFRGTEFILLKGQRVYECEYHGGLIQGGMRNW